MVIDQVTVRRIQRSGPPPDDHDWVVLEWCLSNHDGPPRSFANTDRLSPRFHVKHGQEAAPGSGSPYVHRVQPGEWRTIRS